ncbi:nicotinate-nucleotide adenylyltransferase [Clostridium botulinum]|uniref:Probable nicotinate-nucleotide adenylyltransferase n=1 Tax=Clostridium botulinum (strain Okra / Type B1) TaxID=498213 RepID=NADD_CLOBK|nr:nicotinate-nucleotide adenylyltransferase [Clostridium botulinum]B1ILY3.1 RecName: Full=Probable nicotinate-nucleotide adenylyltransferase; AltName: Full=Deamido-NAD(+) diphosphorylase; AltName: Full=Deamido-NAD(+) pyrophosphorylase; AltName: Full=Nicotinate mononucleotide adenylyltransferase; Short=NaMN adenylyltransferase [Clostridium botulinum B1 str. Okra]EKX80206.1 nicotinic acid mononucleotide adenylyltransferase [Clostridium botulinum CFSAN001628]ACA43453.1 nicotinate nucleotide adenyl
MINKAILGGTFDPIHNAHINVAYEALERFNLEEVIFIPAGNPPHKINLKKTPAHIRYEMVKLAIEKETRFSISDFEIKSKSLSYTYRTLKHFKEKEPETNWYFITGEDCLSYLEHWKYIDEIFNICNFVIFSREGFKEKEEIIKKKKSILLKYRKEILFMDASILDISSTKIRNRIKEGKEVSFYMPDKVYKFILQNNLYK